MIECYSFLSQMPEEILISKQKTVIDRFYNGGSFIYFISDGSHVKIGKADNVFDRLSSLQVGNPRRLILLGISNYGKSEIVKREKDFHKRFEDRKIRGEWFYLTDYDLYSYGGPYLKFTDYFIDDEDFKSKGFSVSKDYMKKNINDRIENNYCKYPY